MKELYHWYLLLPARSENLGTNPYKFSRNNKPVVRLAGYISNHHEFEDGSFVTLSPIHELWESDNQIFVKTTTGSVYVIKEADIRYENAFPNSLKRLKSIFTPSKHYPVLTELA